MSPRNYESFPFHTRQIRRAVKFISAATACLIFSQGSAEAQNSSLFQRYRRDPQAPAVLANTSPYFETVAPPRKVRMHDIITIMVRLQSQVVSEGEAQVRRNGQFDAELRDWVLLDGIGLKPDPQSLGDPEISANLRKQMRSISDMETSDSIQFTVAAEVVDIRPNNVLVLEATQEIHNNEDTWTRKLIGEARAEDILPNNMLLSQNLANLRIYKNETGQVRDGYKRGWLWRAWDKVSPF